MNTLRRLALAALAAAGLTGTASAQYPYPQPPIRTFPPAYPTYPSHSHRPPVIVEQPVFAPPVIVQRPPVVVVQRPPVQVVCCLKSFERDFHACPGHHDILIEHPVTGRPVRVCFDLPDCKLRDIDVSRRRIVFDYGRHEVEIEFHRDGTVCVHD